MKKYLKGILIAWIIVAIAFCVALFVHFTVVHPFIGLPIIVTLAGILGSYFND